MSIQEAFQELYDYAQVNGDKWMEKDLDEIREALEEKIGEPITVYDRLAEEIGL
jgi:hypothetical protein